MTTALWYIVQCALAMAHSARARARGRVGQGGHGAGGGARRAGSGTAGVRRPAALGQAARSGGRVPRRRAPRLVRLPRYRRARSRNPVTKRPGWEVGERGFGLWRSVSRMRVRAAVGGASRRPRAEGGERGWRQRPAAVVLRCIGNYKMKREAAFPSRGHGVHLSEALADRTSVPPCHRLCTKMLLLSTIRDVPC